MKGFDKTEIDSLHDKLLSVLEEFGKKENLSITLRGFKGNSSKVEGSMEFQKVTDDGKIFITEATHAHADHLASVYGIQVDEHFIGSCYYFPGGKAEFLTVTGIAPRARKYKVEVDYDGEARMASPQHIKTGTLIITPTFDEFLLYCLRDESVEPMGVVDAKVLGWMLSKGDKTKDVRYMISKLYGAGALENYQECYDFLTKEKYARALKSL